MGFLDRFFGPPSKEKFARAIIEGLERAGETRQIVYDEEQFCLRLASGNGQVTNLVNLYGEYCSAPRDRRELVVRNTVRNWFLAEQEIPEEYEDAQYDVLPTVRSRSYIEFTLLQMASEGSSGMSWPHQVLGDHLALGLVYDLPQAMRTISQEDLDRWDVSFYQALEAARENLSQIGEQTFIGLSDKVYMSATGDNYDASRLILLDSIRQLEVQGQYVAMVPNRDTLLLAGTDDETGLAMMAALAEEAFKKPRPMSALAFCLEGDDWTLWLPERESPVYASFKLLQVQSMGQEYADQKELLVALHQKRAEEVFVASFSGIQNDKTREITSYCVWSEGVPTLLPRTDRLALLGQDAEAVMFDWELVVDELGHLMTAQDIYPERYRVDAFPTADEFQRLLRRSQS